jgi:glycosyltransferase involved in cell wall biosynthesis
MNPSILSRFHLCNPYKKIVSNCDKVFLLSAGDDYEYWNKFRKGNFIFRSPHRDTLDIDLKQSKSPWEYTRNKTYSKYLSKNCTGIISTADLYSRVYYDNSKFIGKIPFPVILPERPILNKDLIFNKKLKILFGIQTGREGFKGSRYFLEALQKIEREYPNIFEINIVKDVPYATYQSKLADCDILLDQLNAYEPAMNALIAMSLSKVVVGGWQPELFIDSDLKIEADPMVNVDRSVDDIVDKLIELNKNREKVFNIKHHAYEYVKQNHDHRDIAKKYLNIWSAN